MREDWSELVPGATMALRQNKSGWQIALRKEATTRNRFAHAYESGRCPRLRMPAMLSRRPALNLDMCVADGRQVPPAWHALCQDALSAIGNRSRRTVSNLSACLRTARIDIKTTLKDSPVAVSDELLRWTMSRTEHFDVFGISRSLFTDQAWLPLTAVVRDTSIEYAPSARAGLWPTIAR